MTGVPCAPIVGVKLVIVGAPEAATVKLVVLVALFAPFVTEIVPEVAAAGTVVTNVVDVAEVTLDVTPLNLTTLLAAVALKPEPKIVTVVPTGPLAGENPLTPTAVADSCLTLVIFPTAS